MTTPKVRVVTLDHDGGDLTINCVEHLRRTAWPADRLEIVVVDNGSSDGVAARIESRWSDVTVLRSAQNLGFAGGCNLGLRELGDAEYVALVNNDAFVDRAWLERLVAELESQPTLGAACPKIRFAGRFVEVALQSSTKRPGRGDARDLGVRVSGARVGDADVWHRAQLVDGFCGREAGAEDEPEYQWTSGSSVLRLPAAGEGGSVEHASLRLAADQPTPVSIRCGDTTIVAEVGSTPAWYDIALAGRRVKVIHNVGSVLVDDGYGFDRGYLEVDAGQYDAPADVFAWCGAAVVLSRPYLEDVGLFDEALFLYYEDLELAWRGRTRDWQYRTVPSAIVDHLHSASSIEGSALSDYYNERNHLLVLVRHASLGVVLSAFARFALVTASYARRDVLHRVLTGHRPRSHSLRRRLRALGGALWRTPLMLSRRMRDTRANRGLT